jgi:hypothetical protein
MRISLLVVAAVLLPAGAALGAAQIKAPACDALTAWAGKVNMQDTFAVAPQLTLPKAFQDSELVPVFGAAALTWTQEDQQTANQALVACYQEAGKRRDQAAAGALANANRALQGLLPRVNAAIQKSRTDSETFKKQIDGLPDTPELGRALETLIKGNPAAPDGNQFRALPREVAEPSWRLAQSVLTLPNGERETLYKALGERGNSIQAGLINKAESAIAAAPDDAGGVLALMEARQRVAALTDPAARARLAKSADEKAQKARETLRQAKPATWVPPACLDLYRWSGAPGGTAGVALAGRTVTSAFVDERAVPVFGVSVADWSDQDLARFKTLRGLCQAAAQPAATPADADPERNELIQVANRGRWIEGADQPVNDARTTLAAYRKAQQDLAGVLAKVQALPDTAASLPALSQLANDPVQAAVSQEDRVKFVNAINEKHAAIGAHATDAALKGLADVKVAALGDFPKLVAYAGQAAATIPDPRGQQAFGAAVNRSLGEAAGRLLPEFQAKLAALPATPDGAAQAEAAVAKLTGLPDVSRVPAFRPYHEAAEARVSAIFKTLRDQACADLLSSLSVGGDAKQEVWDGDNGMSLGDFICGLAEHGVTVNSYAGAGMFSSTSTLKVTPLREAIETVSMRKAEVKAGKSMLVGFQIKDANGQSRGLAEYLGKSSPDGTLSIQEWEMFATAAKGYNPLEDEACKRLLASPPDKAGPGDKLFVLHCRTLPGLQARAPGRQ